MSVASEITKLNTNISNAYDEIATKGGTIPQNKNTDNLATAISSIPAGTPQKTDSRILITEYTPSTGVIKGQNFGNSGKVYLLDRDTHTYNELQVSSYSDTQVTLSNPIDTTNIVGTTCFYVAPTGKDISNKQMVYGDLPVLGYGIVYMQDDKENPTTIRKVYINDANTLNNMGYGNSSNTFWTYEHEGNANYVESTKVVGFQFGSSNSLLNLMNNFLVSCFNLNQPIFIPTWIRLGNYFLRECETFDSPVVFEDRTGATSLNPVYFITRCYNFNQPIDFSKTDFYGADLLEDCWCFNQKIIPSTSADFYSQNNLLRYCRSFNQPLVFNSNHKTIGNNFLSGCYSYNQPLDFLSQITTLGSSFLENCYSFNQQITIPSTWSTIPNNFLIYNYCFNQPLDLSNITTIGNGFLTYCQSYNQSVSLPSITSIGNNFLASDKQYNKPITFGNNNITIGNNFLNECSSFNQPFDISKITTIGNSFMQSNFSFSYPLTLNATSIGGYFMYEAYSIQKITVNTNPTTITTDNYSLASGNSFARIRTKGVKIYGQYRSQFMTALPNRTGYPTRILIDGGS